MTLKFYTDVAKGLKLKVRKFLGLIQTFVELKGEAGKGRLFCSHIRNRVNTEFSIF